MQSGGHLGVAQFDAEARPRVHMAVEAAAGTSRVRAPGSRVHLVRAFVRMALLIPLDIGVFVGWYLGLQWVAAGTSGTTQVLAEAALANLGPGLHTATAIVIGMFAVDAYRAGDRWQDPIRLFGAIGMGLLLSMYGAFWARGWAALAVASAAWLAIGTTTVAVRRICGFAMCRMPSTRLIHRVLEIGHAEVRGADDESLGPQYLSVGRLEVHEVPQDIEEMEHWLDRGVDTLVVSGEVSPADFGRLADFALAHGCRLLGRSRSDELAWVDPRRVWLGGRPYSELTAPGLRISQLFVKRCVDLLVATLLFALLSPLMAVLALAVKLGSPGPILFRHRRAGYQGRFFTLMKFRSMCEDAEKVLKIDPELYARYVANHFKIPEREDPRTTPLGRFLRRSSLDELPQLINVIKGDMSLVGPRPVVEAELEMYRGRIPAFLSVKPGITGPWQVAGRSSIGFPERAEMDLNYVRNWSLLRDFWILVMTIPAVLLQRGAH